MNREILFRGKSGDGWHYGLLTKYENHKWRVVEEDNNMITVKNNTIGQYTGLTDKNGTKIFEGDVVRISEDYYDGLHYSGNEVYYSDGAFCVEYETLEYDVTSIGFLVREGVEVEVIGNIYDNPELLQENS